MSKKIPWLGCLLFILIVSSGYSFVQNTDSLLTLMRQKFSSFEYVDAIKLSDIILQKKEALPKQQLLEIYRIKGVSDYSLGDEQSSEESFVAMLKLDSTYVLEPDFNSPKIIAFFNDLKAKHPERINQQETFVPADQLDLKMRSLNYELKNTIVRSLVIPGWGHLYQGQTTKGVIITSISIASMLSSAYFINDCSHKEKEYLSESDRSIIPAKYDKYNKSYWLRNISLITFVTAWIYSQVDLLLFNTPEENNITLTGNFISENTCLINFKLQL